MNEQTKTKQKKLNAKAFSELWQYGSASHTIIILITTLALDFKSEQNDNRKSHETN